MSESPPQSSAASLGNDGHQLAALDLGSNSFHLLIAQEIQGRIQVIDKHKEMVRLAQGLTDAGLLNHDASAPSKLQLRELSVEVIT